MIGPPSSPEKDGLMMGDFFGCMGIHIVCGGTTASIAASYLGKPLEVALDYQSSDIPPVGRIEGVELVTEGVVTVGMVLERARNLLQRGDADYRDKAKIDGVSSICRLLFDAKGDINFFVGTAVNNAHQSPRLAEINFQRKMNIINELVESLKLLGKNVSVRYY